MRRMWSVARNGASGRHDPLCQMWQVGCDKKGFFQCRRSAACRGTGNRRWPSHCGGFAEDIRAGVGDGPTKLGAKSPADVGRAVRKNKQREANHDSVGEAMASAVFEIIAQQVRDRAKLK